MIVLFNKPYGVLSQYTDRTAPDASPRPTLQGFGLPPHVFPAGRLDFDSEGLLLLSDDKREIGRVTEPRWQTPKTYVVQVEGVVTDDACAQLVGGVQLRDGWTQAAEARAVAAPAWLWPRTPAIRVRKTIPDSFLELTITEGRNRQVRRMTAAAGLPTLRLIRVRIGPHQLGELLPGQWRTVSP